MKVVTPSGMLKNMRSRDWLQIPVILCLMFCAIALTIFLTGFWANWSRMEWQHLAIAIFVVLFFLIAAYFEAKPSD